MVTKSLLCRSTGPQCRVEWLVTRGCRREFRVRSFAVKRAGFAIDWPLKSTKEEGYVPHRVEAREGVGQAVGQVGRYDSVQEL